MVSDIIEQLNSDLDEISDNVRRLEASHNRVFEVMDGDTIQSFHIFNINFQSFVKYFDRNDVSHILQISSLKKAHSQFSERYLKLIREQLLYCTRNDNFYDEFIAPPSPVFLSEDESTDVLGYYKECLENEKDEEGNSLYDITKEDESVVYDVFGSETLTIWRLESDKINKAISDNYLKTYKCLNRLLALMNVVCDFPRNISPDYNFSQDEIIAVLDRGLRQYAKDVDKTVERQLKKIAQEYKSSRSTSITPEIWGMVMDREDKMYEQAIKTQVGEIDDKYLENISVERGQLIDNYSLLQKIGDTCLDGELFDIELAVKTHNLLNALDADNLDVFYELVLRRNIVQREMFPDQLRDKYEEWLNKSDEQQDATTEREELSEARQSKLTEIIEILKRGNWKEPATADNIEQLLNTVFGKDTSLLDDDDKPQCEMMWGLVESGRGIRENIVSANLAGYFAEQSLLKGSPKVISNDLYGKNNDQSSNINKGNKKNSSPSFKEIVPFLNKYINKIIRQK